MKKGVVLTLLVAVLAWVAVASVYATGPTVLDMPDVLIGDAEDQAGSVDQNIFQYPDAFDFTDYVTDPNTTPSWIIWEFDESDGVSATTDYSVNGSAAGAANITSVPTSGGLPTGEASDTMADFRNETVSPSAGTPPFADPTSDYERFVTFWASDGELEDSTTITVKIADGGFDQLGGGGVDPQEFSRWVSSSIPSVYGDPLFDNSGGSLDITADEGSDGYGLWQYDFITYPDDLIPYEEDMVYQIGWTLSSDQATQTDVPGCRMLVANIGYTFGGSTRIASGSLGEDATDYDQSIPAAGTSEVFTQFIEPPDMGTLSADLKEINLEFDLINFPIVADDTGTISVEDITINLVSTSNFVLGTPVWTATSDSDFSSWIVDPDNSISGQAQNGAISGGIYLSSPEITGTLDGDDAGFILGQFSGPIPSDNGVELTADTLYVVTFTASSANQSDLELLPSLRFRVQTSDFENSSLLRMLAIPGRSGETLPGTSSRDYNVYFLPKEPAGGFSPVIGDADGSTMYFGFDLIDLNEGGQDQQGQLQLEEINVYELDATTFLP